jgi:hypothetical protein
MISIGHPFVYEDGEFAYLKARISISADTSDAYIEASKKIKKVHWRVSEDYPPREWGLEGNGLWFGVPLEFKKYLCAERSDAFVVAMLWYAMVTGSDIESEAPMSERMVFHVSNYLIPALCTPENGYRRISIIGPTTNVPCSNEGGVGTGMSCGVDSFYSLHMYSQESIPKKYRLTHLTYFNMGAIFHPNRSEKKKYTIKEFYETTDRMSEEKRENARQVAQQSNLPLLYIKSNLDKDYYRGAYGHTGVYRNCAMALSVQGLFSIYYNSSGGWPGYFDLSLTEGSQHYEALLCSCLSTESLTFILSDYVTRAEKTFVIADDTLAQKYLDVCFCFNSCGKCSKCIRTLVTLDIFGKLDQFSDVFDIDYYKAHRTDAYLEVLKTKDGDDKDDNAVFAKDLYRMACSKGIIPRESQRLYDVYLAKQKVRVLRRKLKSILKRK